MLQFVILTFLISWLIWIPGVIWWISSGAENLPLWLLVEGLLGAYGPSIAALILTLRNEGTAGARKLIGRLTFWRVGLGWWVAALFGFPAMLALAIAIYGLTGGTLGQFRLGEWYIIIPVALLTALPFGPLGEELGWRGYALPHLQSRHSAMTSSMIIGVVWTIWHLPLFWIPGAALGIGVTVSAMPVALYMISTVGTAIVFTWLFNNTRGSVLLAIVIHMMGNASGRILFAWFPELTEAAVLQITSIALGVKWAVVVLLVAVFGWRRLSLRPFHADVCSSATPTR